MAWSRSVPSIDNETKTTKKRIQWRWLVLGALAVAVVAVIAQSFQKAAVLNPNDVKWKYQVVDGGIILGTKDETAVPKEISGVLLIPEIIDGKPVMGIGDRAFCDCAGLKSVTIPSSVTNIGIQAFRDCSSLTSVTIPKYVESIGNWAFKGTPFYDNMPDGMVILGGGVLYAYKGNCPSVLTIPDNVKCIGYGVFKGCGGLMSVTISEGVREIGAGAFKDCVGLKSVTIPSNEFTIGCESIGYEAFAGCGGLTSLALPEGVVSIGQRAFKGCAGIKSLTIPSTVTSIGSGAFAGCRDLRAVTIPASLKALDSTWPWRRAWERQFQDCGGISVTIMPGMTRSVCVNACFRTVGGLIRWQSPRA